MAKKEKEENVKKAKPEMAPLLPMTMYQAKRFTRILLGVGRALVPVFPSLANYIKKALIHATAEEYLAISVFFSGAAAVIGFVLGYFYLVIIYGSILTSIFPAIFIGILFGAFALLIHTSIPASIAAKRGKDIDRDLAFALKDLLMQTKSGVNLFTAMRNISESNYGLVSEEFGRTLDEIETGVSSEEALTQLALRCDSDFLNRTIWQLINAMKAGAALETTLVTVVDDISEFQKDQINQYGKTLGVFAMVYLVFALVFPSIGVSFGILFLSVMGMEAYSQLAFIGGGFGYIIFVGIILSMVKSQKPMVF